MKVLIADDESITANNIKMCLESEVFEGEHFNADLAENGEAALQLLKSGYDLVILDLRMPLVNGIHIVEAIDLMEPKKQPLVVLITAYPDDYKAASIGAQLRVQALVPKPFELPELMGVIRGVLKSRRQLLEAERHGIKPRCDWTLAFSDIGSVFIQVNGLQNFADSCYLPWTKSDMLMAERKAEVAGELFNASGHLHRHHKSFAKDIGVDLFKKLFTGDIQQSFIAAGSVVLHNEDLRLSFLGPRHYLKLPLEFLHDGSDYLVLRHPMRRFITGIRFRGNTGISQLINEMQGNREKLKVLLIASNTRPRIGGVDEEVEAVYNLLCESLPPNSFVIDYLKTEEATFDEVMARLNGCRYHILHYAGHGSHDQNFPGRSSLCFWEKKNCQGELKDLSVNKFKNTLLMKEHNLRFIYLSCCFGTATSNEEILRNDTFLGMADGLILAGVPSVLGFRWPVSDRGAKELATAFYTSLFDQGRLDTALFNARCKVAGSEEEQDFGDWLSPILIVQE
jgi:CheY-like chemotaxis protein